ncbi:MAG: redox-sensing transcriptional repressor Rex [Clostridia bacterium]|nr:redox-sensing transcriptional repressor Rex [Clostridia bacterium]
MDKSSVSKATLGRMPSYLGYLKGLGADESKKYVSATMIARELKLGEVQVRKDLCAVSGAGKPKLGYLRESLIKALEDFLGYNRLTPTVLVGAGKLGKALLEYDDFQKYGIEIVAAFDRNKEAIKYGNNKEILPMSAFKEVCEKQDVKIGIITVGEGSAQEVADTMVVSGIKAIWNFAPIKLKIPDEILVQQESLALSLAHLRNQLTNIK